MGDLSVRSSLSGRASSEELTSRASSPEPEASGVADAAAEDAEAPRVGRSSSRRSSTSSSSSTTTTSSASSSSSSSSSGAAGPQHESEALGAPVAAPQQSHASQPDNAVATANGAGEDEGQPQARAQRAVAVRAHPPMTHSWGVFRVTPLRKDGMQRGWQLTCRHPNHPATTSATTVCSRSMVWTGADASEELVLRTLKDWALRGLGCASKQAHQALRNAIAADLPSMEDLDAHCPEAWPE